MEKKKTPAKKADPKAEKPEKEKAPAKKAAAEKAPVKKAAAPSKAEPPKPAAKPEAPKKSYSFNFDDIASLASATAEPYSLHTSKGAAPEKKAPPPPAAAAPAPAPAVPAKPAAAPAPQAAAPTPPAPAAPAAGVAPAAPARPAVPGAPAPLKPLTPGAAKPAVPGAPAPLKPGVPPAPLKPGVPAAPLSKPGAPAPLKPGTGAAPRPPQAPLKPGTGGLRPTNPAQAPNQQPGYRPPPAPMQRPGMSQGNRPSSAPPRPHAPAQAAAPAPVPEKAPLKKLTVSGQVTVRELAEKLGVKVNDLIKKMIGQGVFATINQRLDNDTANIIAQDFGYDLEVSALYGEAEIAKMTAVTDKPEDLKPRAPVVTVMGHVNHGKTSLLDSIRVANVAAGEAGGITQHIGAYRVPTSKGIVTFLDTPGHEAFTAMRSRGAKVTDIVILVVSATDGVMPQTIEAIDHAKAANVPIVIAVNKIDLPGANPQKIRQELAGHGLNPEEWGGKNIYVNVSAKKRLNIDKLLEMVMLQAEILELRANPTRPGMGTVIEAKMEAKRGNVCTLLVQTGTVRVGDAFVAGQSFGRIRALIDDKGQRVQEAGPSTPVEILGIGSPVPQAGDGFNIVTDDRQAKEIAEKRRLIHREESIAHQKHVSLIGLKGANLKELNVILKADVQGSLQALKDSLEKLSTAEITLKVLHSGIGNINESDVLLANASDAVVLAFHVDTEPRAATEAERLGIEIKVYQIIYDLIADVKAAMEGLLEPEIVDVITGKLDVRASFNVSGVGKVGGGVVTEGKLTRNAMARLVRGGAVLHTSKITSLKKFKDDAKEVEKGLECGVAIDGWQDYKAGDRLEAFVQEKRVRRLESSPAQ